MVLISFVPSLPPLFYLDNLLVVHITIVVLILSFKLAPCKFIRLLALDARWESLHGFL